MKKAIKLQMVNKKRFIGFITCSSVLTTMLIVFLFSQISVQGKAENNYVHIYIAPDDTLWAIAQDYNYQQKDIREFIFEIMNENNMKTAMLIPGEKIKIPME